MSTFKNAANNLDGLLCFLLEDGQGDLKKEAARIRREAAAYRSKMVKGPFSVSYSAFPDSRERRDGYVIGPFTKTDKGDLGQSFATKADAEKAIAAAIEHAEFESASKAVAKSVGRVKETSNLSGPFAILANESMLSDPIYYKGVTYPSVAHAIAAMRIPDRQERQKVKDSPKTREKGRGRGRTIGEIRGEIAAIRIAPVSTVVFNPSPIAKRAAKYGVRSDWDSVKDTILRDLLEIKLKQPKAKAALAGSKGRNLVYSNVNHDTYFGKCRCRRHKGQGENVLGKMLMSIRDGS